MPPTDRPLPRFAAEPPQEPLPYGRWSQRLQAEFLAACLRIETGEEDVGEPSALTWFPDRGWGGRTYQPCTTRTSTGWEVYGYVSYVRGEDGEGQDFEAHAEATDVVADDNPEWRIDISDAEIGAWRGRDGKVAAITLVWGVPLVNGGALATAELGGRADETKVTVDQCPLEDNRFTLVAPDRYPYDDDVLEVRLYDRRGRELARESLYEDEDYGEDAPADEGSA